MRSGIAALSKDIAKLSASTMSTRMPFSPEFHLLKTSCSPPIQISGSHYTMLASSKAVLPTRKVIRSCSAVSTGVLVRRDMSKAQILNHSTSAHDFWGTLMAGTDASSAKEPNSCRLVRSTVQGFAGWMPLPQLLYPPWISFQYSQGLKLCARTHYKVLQFSPQPMVPPSPVVAQPVERAIEESSCHNSKAKLATLWSLKT